MVARGGEHRTTTSVRRHIGGDGMCFGAVRRQLGDGDRQGTESPSGQDEAGAFARKSQRKRQADAGSAAGNEDALAVEIHRGARDVLVVSAATAAKVASGSGR
jgi:hypothetical protein